MYQIDNSTALPTMPTPAAAGTPGWFTGGSPGAGVPATILDSDWLNTVQAELIAILTAAGITPTKGQDAQLLAAIDALIVAGGSANAQSIAAELYGIAVVTTTGGTLALTAQQYGCGIILVEGALTADAHLTFPTAGAWRVSNLTTGAYNVYCGTAAGTSYVVRQNFRYRIYGDGANIQPDGQQSFSGSTAVGALAPTLQPNEAYDQYTS
jgi:hypothetical protein